MAPKFMVLMLVFLAVSSALAEKAATGVGKPKKDMRSSQENLLEAVSYFVVFAAFGVFVWRAKMRYGNDPVPPSNLLAKSMWRCVSAHQTATYDKVSDEESAAGAPLKMEETMGQKAAKLATCTLGIQVSYILWGIMQEQIMTQTYSDGRHFQSSKFLVFANRIIALCLAASVAHYQHTTSNHPPVQAPLYRFSFCSGSNILSSACQYEALKYISFPTQVLAKSCKMIPVMLMGYAVSRKVYSVQEYATALLITTGVVIFKLNEENDAPVKNTEMVGVLLIVGYMTSDSFTSNWQSKLFKEYEISSVQMMAYVNFFSSLFTFSGLFVTMEITYVLDFLLTNTLCIWHISIMSVCSAVGQMFIFYTIKEFGPLVFATIQTVRQLLSVIFSIMVFGHAINMMECVGIGVVFLTLSYEIYSKYQAKRNKMMGQGKYIQ